MAQGGVSPRAGFAVLVSGFQAVDKSAAKEEQVWSLLTALGTSDDAIGRRFGEIDWPAPDTARLPVKTFEDVMKLVALARGVGDRSPYAPSTPTQQPLAMEAEIDSITRVQLNASVLAALKQHGLKGRLDELGWKYHIQLDAEGMAEGLFGHMHKFRKEVQRLVDKELADAATGSVRQEHLCSGAAVSSSDEHSPDQAAQQFTTDPGVVQATVGIPIPISIYAGEGQPNSEGTMDSQGQTSSNTDSPSEVRSSTPVEADDDAADDVDADDTVASASAQLDQFSEDADKSQLPSDSSPACPVCLEDVDDLTMETLPCGHDLCETCLTGVKKSGQEKCPSCMVPFGRITGNQPKDAKMTTRVLNTSLPGHPEYGTIQIIYHIPAGVQTEEHRNPGVSYTGDTRVAFLPDTSRGRHLRDLLQCAFDARLIFTIGHSPTRGTDDVVTWNDIHHKTSNCPGTYGYPDPGYLDRLEDELAARGIK